MAGGPDGSPLPGRQAASSYVPAFSREHNIEQEPSSQTLILARTIAGASLIIWRDADAMHMCNAEQFRARHDLDAVN